MEKKKAFLLFSGGLDSIIAAKLLKELGFEVVGVHITCPFFEKEPEKVKELAEKLGIELRVVKAGDDYLELLKRPVYGYGKNVNPCIDCKAYMLRKLKEVAEKEGGGIIATGEVLGQRPMSQRLDAFRKIEKLSGLKGRVLRPLSGKLLPETEYEKEGLVKREELLGLRGRSRKAYPEILKKLSIELKELPTPSGGCLLTEPSFAVKVKELMEHGELSWEEVELLKVGRHFRVGKCKLIVGRNQRENQELLKRVKEGELILKVETAPSPVGLLKCKGEEEREVLETAASIVARYSDAKNEPEVPVSVYRNGKLIEVLKVKPNFEARKYQITL
jgi:tRNA U34 2-thiouridine synthase MnmA/TrmU